MTFFSILFWRGDFFLTHYFCQLFFTKVTLHVLQLLWEHNSNKGMLLKPGVGGWAKIFQQCHGGGGGDFFPVYSRGWGGGRFFFSPIDFAEPPPTPAINNERSLMITYHLEQSLAVVARLMM